MTIARTKILLLAFFLLTILFSRNILAISVTVNNENEISKVFQLFENGIKIGAVKEFSDLLYYETYISLENGVSSYFSSNQSFYILEEYLATYKPVSFKLIKVSLSEDKPYAIGRFIYSKNGIKGESQVFVSLKLYNSHWKIFQITIN